MSYLGTRYSIEAKEAIQLLPLGACKSCKYKAKIQFEHLLWKDYICSRCGILFPAQDIKILRYKIEHLKGNIKYQLPGCL